MTPPRAFHAMARAVGRHPIATLIALALALLPLLVMAGRVRPDNSLESWFVEGDPALRRYEAFLREYGNDEAVLVGFDTPEGARSDSALALQQRIVRRLVGIDGVARVVAPAALPPVLARGLEAEDGRAAGLVAWMDVRPDLEAQRGRIIDAIAETARAELAPLGRTPHLAGNGVLYEGLNRQTMQDTGVFLGLALLAMLGLVRLGLRSWRAVVLALVAPLAAAGAGVGLMQLFGRPFTVVSSALPTLILVIGLADSIHVLMHYEQVRRAEPPPDEGVRRAQVASAIAWIAVPCFFTSLTTAAGFFALATSRTALVRDFGIFAGVGMLLAWAVTLTFLAAALARWDVPPPERGARGGWIARVLGRYAAAAPRMRGPVIATAIAIALVLALGARRVQVDTDTIGLLPAGHEVRRDSEWLERRLGAYTPLEMVVTNAGLTPADFARRVEEWRRRAERLPDVERTFTAAGATTDGRPAGGAYVSQDGRSIRVTAYVPMTTSTRFARAADALEREGAAVFGTGARVEATGYLPLYVRISDYVVQSTLTGLASSFVLVFALMALLIRTGRGMLAAIPVNGLPVLLVFGIMGWARIPLDLATATVGTIVLGIVVDDTIHFLHRYREERRVGRPPGRAAGISLQSAGEGIVLTTAALVCGFGVMIAAGTKSIAYFGLISTLAIAGAMFADLLLLPALLSIRGGVEVEELPGDAVPLAEPADER